MPTIRTGGVDSLAEARAFQRALHRLLRLIEFRERELAAVHAISPTQCQALLLLADEQGLPVNDLAARLCLDKSTVSRVAAGLEAKGYVARTKDGGDRRIVRLTATPSGHSLRLRLQDDLASLYGELLSAFDPEVRAAMTRMVARLADSGSDRIETSRGSCRWVC